MPIARRGTTRRSRCIGCRNRLTKPPTPWRSSARQYQALEGLLKIAAKPVGRCEERDRGRRQTARRPSPTARRASAGSTCGAGGGGGGGGFGGQQQQNVRGQIGQTKGQIMNSHSLPSEQQLRVLTDGRGDLAKVIQETNALITAMPALFDKIGASGLKPAALKPVQDDNDELGAQVRRVDYRT